MNHQLSSGLHGVSGDWQGGAGGGGDRTQKLNQNSTGDSGTELSYLNAAPESCQLAKHPTPRNHHSKAGAVFYGGGGGERLSGLRRVPQHLQSSKAGKSLSSSD